MNCKCLRLVQNIFNISFHFVFSFIASLCGSLRVKLKNEALTQQSYWQGSYQFSLTVNGRPSWTSKSRAIWYVPQFKDYRIGHLKDIGATRGGITASENDEVADPQHIMYWKYHKDGDGWVSPTEESDIIVECIDGM